MSLSPKRYAFFLGGQDLEMVEIAALLSRLKIEGDARIAALHDRSLPWGAKASDHGESIWNAYQTGLIPVLIELAEDMSLPPSYISIDHHGDRSGEPSALRQIFELLGLPPQRWSRRMALVDANDRGHIEAMRQFGARREEMEAIRAEDRRAQGISLEEEASGRAAMARLRQVLAGTLLIADLPHSRTATLCDPLALSGEMRDLLVFCPESTQFFGSGERIARLEIAYPGGWRGGQLPLRGYWGLAENLEEEAVISTLG